MLNGRSAMLWYENGGYFWAAQARRRITFARVKTDETGRKRENQKEKGGGRPVSAID